MLSIIIDDNVVVHVSHIIDKSIKYWTCLILKNIKNSSFTKMNNPSQSRDFRQTCIWSILSKAEAHSETSQTSKMYLFAKIAND